MVETASTMLALGTAAPDFCLPDTLGHRVRRGDFAQKPALLVVFMCNHCSFARHILDQLVQLVNDYQPKGLAAVAINANDIDRFPDDRPEKMAQIAQQRHFTFPYLFDESQQVARAYHAACTPDFFLFDQQRKLVYRGQMDDSRPGNNIPVTGHDLRIALDALLAGQPVPYDQKPSIGCNIKWKP